MLRMSLGGLTSVLAIAAGVGLVSPSGVRADHRSYGYVSYGPRYVSPAHVVFTTPKYVSYAPSCTSYATAYSTYTPTYVSDSPSYANFAATVYSPSTYYAPAPVVYERPVYYSRPVVYAPRPVFYPRPAVVTRPVYTRPYYATSGVSFGFGYGHSGRHRSHGGGFSVRVGR